jgi:hypothetical protein
MSHYLLSLERFEIIYYRNTEEIKLKIVHRLITTCTSFWNFSVETNAYCFLSCFLGTGIQVWIWRLTCTRKKAFYCQDTLTNTILYNDLNAYCLDFKWMPLWLLKWNKQATTRRGSLFAKTNFIICDGNTTTTTKLLFLFLLGEKWSENNNKRAAGR